MRLRPIALLTLFVAALAAPATAVAKPVVGISSNVPEMFGDANFTALGAKHARLVVAYNTMTANGRGDNEYTDRIVPYLDAAKAHGVNVLVTFEHARGNATGCNKKANKRKAQCKLPSVKEYKADVKAFLRSRPDVKTIAPWNEANHYTQPTAKNPKRAAQFTDAVAKACKELKRKCEIVAADVLDQADNAKAAKPTYRKTARWIQTFRRSLKTKRTICGIHNYSDVNRFRTSGLKALKNALGCKQYWLTETGGLFDFGSFWNKQSKKAGRCKTAAACQLKATKFLFSSLKRDRKVKRVYLYTWYGGNVPRFDAGLVTGKPGKPTKPRKAYHEAKKHI